MADVEERHAARALAPQARNVTWAADGTPWQRFLRASSGGRSGRQPIGWTVIRLDAPWQDTPSSERSGWRERVANLADDIAFAVDYTVCTACRLGWVEWPYTMEKYQRCELATAALEAPRLECPGTPWAATSRTPAPLLGGGGYRRVGELPGTRHLPARTPGLTTANKMVVGPVLTGIPARRRR